MSVTSTNNRNDYVGDGTTVAFAYTFKIFQNTDLKVYVNGALKTLTTDYTVTGAGAVGGGTVTFVVAPANAAKVSIQRSVPYDQQTNYTDNDKFPASTTNDALDKLTMLVQQIKELVGRAFTFGTTSLLSGVIFPDLVASKYPRVNAGATGFDLVDISTAGLYVSPLTTLGDIIYGAAAGTQTRLAGNTSATKKFLSQIGDGANSAAPAWGTVDAADVATGTIAPARLGTGSGGATKFLREDSTFQSIMTNNAQVFTSSGSFAVPAGTKTLWVTAVAAGGGGGGGGGSSSNTDGGNGGGGGAGETIQRVPVFNPTGTLTITIGAGGTAGSAGVVGGANGGTGGTGGNTSVTGLPNGVSVTAAGGSGGLGGVTASVGVNGAGGNGGTGGGAGGGTGGAGAGNTAGLNAAAGNDGTVSVGIKFGGGGGGGGGSTGPNNMPGAGGGYFARTAGQSTNGGAGGGSLLAGGAVGSGVAGAANTGAGGGGGIFGGAFSTNGLPGGAGGSGLVVIEWETT